MPGFSDSFAREPIEITVCANERESLTAQALDIHTSESEPDNPKDVSLLSGGYFHPLDPVPSLV
jgi:hypothetical protein